jgi:hypothetical protein
MHPCRREPALPHHRLPIYERLLKADLVVADLSTYNVNAVFELGVRYALRPHATILVAEEQFQSPFLNTKQLLERAQKKINDGAILSARACCSKWRAGVVRTAAS